MFTRTSAAFDHLAGRLVLMANVSVPPQGGEGELRDLYRRAIASLESMAASLAASVPRDASSDVYFLSQETDFQGVSSNFTREEYEAAVERAREYIYAGDAFQVVPSQRWTQDFALPPFALYRSLRRTNPSPFLFYFNFGGFQIVGASPEILVRVFGREVTIRPIAGTRPRGATGEPPQHVPPARPDPACPAPSSSA